MYNDLKIYPVDLIGYDVSKDEIKSIKENLLNNSNDNEYIIETQEALFCINKKDKTLRILRRYYCKKNSSEYDIDMEIGRVCKIARKSGIEVIYENYLLN